MICYFFPETIKAFTFKKMGYIQLHNRNAISVKLQGYQDELKVTSVKFDDVWMSFETTSTAFLL